MTMVQSPAKDLESAAANMFDSSDDEAGEDYDVFPLKVDWLNLSEHGCPEELGICALPGCKFKNTWRRLSTDIELLKSHEIKDVFVLCTRGELGKYRVPSLLQEYSNADITVHHYPFPDGNIPHIATLHSMLEEIKLNLMQGRKSLIHCYGGLGRSCLVSVCLLMFLDESVEPDAAMQRLKQLRGPAAIQSIKQYNFIKDFRENLAEFEKSKEGAARSISL